MKTHIRPVRTFAISATSFLFTLAATLLVITALAACAGTPENTAAAGNAKKTDKKTMRAFASEEEMKAYFRKLAEERKRELGRRRSDSSGLANTSPPPAPTAQANESAKSGAKDEDSVTNTQHAGVDEGGIVKLHGDHLVVLRRGRLFTVAVGDNALKPISAVDAFGPEINPRSTWYDEMLVSDDTVVVIGYSYERGGTEVGLFNIDGAGSLGYRSTYHLRSNDYYSSRNYASRLIGNKLIFYTPQYLGYHADPIGQFPAVRRWHKGATDKEFKPVVKPTSVYRAEKPMESSYGMALHTITVCDLAGGDFDCSATAVLGAAGRVFYVSPTSVYVWTIDWSHTAGKANANSLLYRMPLDASAPSALGVTGGPI